MAVWLHCLNDLLEATKDLQKVANLMGHYKENGESNIQMTIIYTTPSKEDRKRSVMMIQLQNWKMYC
ncbi:hypothetical protein [Paenibacillus sp. UASWS1643]|uniref:hypothetical protein n=1 Tax=Paenibacillus sp. UASWS1643 TaxID=2580422 RepID=UPI0016889B10|nr:hypothetical protein [Paenibacillus sp. UASWS1643]